MENEEDRKEKNTKVSVCREKDEIQEKEENSCEIDQIGFTEKLSINTSSDDDDEVVIIGTKGPVALRDFPHPRDLCANFPFNTTPHEMFCSNCYCVLCEINAPCSQWKGNAEHNGHCDISKKCKDVTEKNNSSEEKTIFALKIEPEK